MKISKKVVVAGLVGLIIGALVTTAIRFALYKPDSVHYHANFSLYVNGVLDKFDGPGYYEEETACTSSNSDNPRTRIHLHDQNPGLVHIHSHAVMWADLFANIGYGLSDQAVTTTSNVYVNGQDGNKLSFVLNGKTVSNVSGRMVNTEDVLLINYGKDDQSTIDKRYNAVPRDAHKSNTEDDPATCSGSRPITFKEKLKKAVGL